MSLVLTAGIEGWNASAITFRSTAENVGKTVTASYTVELQSGKTVTETVTKEIVHYTNCPYPFYGFVGTNFNTAYGENPVNNPNAKLEDGTSYMSIPIDYFEGEPVEVTIPTCRNPFKVIVNGKSYSYPAGTTQVVPTYVAEVIESHVDMQPQEDPYAGKTAKVVEVKNTTFYFPSGYVFAYATSSDPKAQWEFAFDRGKGMFKLGGDVVAFATSMAKASDFVNKYIIPNPALIIREDGANEHTDWESKSTYYGKCAILIEKVDTDGYPVGTLFMVEG